MKPTVLIVGNPDRSWHWRSLCELMTEHYDVQVVKPGDVWVGEDADCMVWGDLVEVVPAGEWVNRDRRQRVGKGERKRNKAERWR